MRQVAAIVGSFLLVLTALTLAGSSSFYALAGILAYALFLLFFSKPAVSRWFLAGTTIGFELLLSERFGLATLLAVVILMLHEVFGERLRFTSRYVRYIVGLALMDLAFAAMLFPPSFLALRLERLALAYPVSALVAYFLVRRIPHEHHEFI